jgi:3-phenylpropionate/trans-cinnamate dioxygenase ferredoxin reductase component
MGLDVTLIDPLETPLQRVLGAFYRDVHAEHGVRMLLGGVGARVAYDRLPYSYSDQYDVGMEYNGHGAAWDGVVVRGDLAHRRFIAFWLRNNRVTAAMNVNVWDMGPDIQALIRAGGPVDAGRLADTAVALGDLLPAAARDA